MKKTHFALAAVPATVVAGALVLAAPAASWGQMPLPTYDVTHTPATVNSVATGCNVETTVDGPLIAITGDWASPAAATTLT